MFSMDLGVKNVSGLKMGLLGKIDVLKSFAWIEKGLWVKMGLSVKLMF